MFRTDPKVTYAQSFARRAYTPSRPGSLCPLRFSFCFCVVLAGRRLVWNEDFSTYSLLPHSSAVVSHLTPEPHPQACILGSNARTLAQGELDERDVRELNEAVVAVEERLHQAW